MVANISQVDGQSEAITTLTPAWWDSNKQYVADHYLTSEEIWGNHGLLNHEYDLRCLFDEEGNEIDGFRRTVRKDTGVTLGVGMKKGYKVVQPRQALGWMDSLQNDGVMKYASAGVLNDGAQIWVLGCIPPSDTDNAVDDLRKYILWIDDFTGSKSLLWFPCFTRVECENTANAAKRERDCNLFKGIRHTGDMEFKLQAARQAIIDSETAFQQYNADCRKLIQTDYSVVDAKRYVDALVPLPLTDAKRSATIRERKVEAIRDGMRHPSSQSNDMKGSWYQLYNAVTFAVDHGNLFSFRGQGDKRANNRWKSLLTGDGAVMKAQALDLALTMVG